MINEHLKQLKEIKTQLETMVPEFKAHYGNKYKTQTMREIAEHSNFFQIEIHPNIVDELIQRERLDRANAFVKSKLAVLSAAELANVQIEIQLVMINQEIETTEAKIASDTPAVNPAEYDPQLMSENKFDVEYESSTPLIAKKGKKK